MNKFYKENGQLSDHGLCVTSSFKIELYKLLNQHEDVKEMSEAELRAFGCCLQKIVGDAVSDRIKFKNYVDKQVKAMKDELALLKEKYSPRWVLVTLPDEDLPKIVEKEPEPDDRCTGSIWHDEYGNSTFQHDEFTYCPIHDK